MSIKVKHIWANYVTTLPVGVSSVTLLTLLLLLLKGMVFDNTPELWAGASDLGNILHGILQSIVASFVFYFALQHVPSQRERWRLLPTILYRSEDVARSAHTLCRAIAREGGRSDDATDRLERDDWHKVLLSVNPTRTPQRTQLVSGISWVEYIRQQGQAIHRDADRCFALSAHISSTHLSLIGRIDRSQFLREVEHSDATLRDNTSMQWISDSFSEFADATSRLRQCNSHLRNEAIRMGHTLDRLRAI